MDLRYILMLIIETPLLIVAIVLAAQAWRGMRQARASSQWSQTSGRVINSEVRETTVNVRRNSSLTYRTVTRYTHDIVYEYQVGGKRFQSATLQKGSASVSSDTSAAEKQVARYPLGSQVLVYYNPANPEGAVLIPHTGSSSFVLLIVAALVLVIGVAVLVFILSSSPLILK